MENKRNINLYYYPVCPNSNKIRILLKYLKINHNDIGISTRQDFSRMPKVDFEYFPVLEANGRFYKDIQSIMLFLLQQTSAINSSLITDWITNENIDYLEVVFSKYMFFDIYKGFVFEKTQQLILKNEFCTHANILKIDTKILENYFEKIEEILKRQHFLSGSFSVNEFSFFGMFAALDYCMLVPWNKFPEIKRLYTRLKTQQDFNFILKSKIYNFSPPNHYEKLDF